MSEYVDSKNQKHKVLQTVREAELLKKDHVFRENLEREIVEELYKILKPKALEEAELLKKTN